MKHIILVFSVFFSLQAFAQQDAAQAPAVGEKAPELQLSEVIQGPSLSTISLEKLKGKVVVLEFWTTWCGPCVGAFPHINELVNKYKGKPVVFIAVTTDGSHVLMSSLKEKAARILHNRPLDSWIVVDAEGALTGNRYKVSSFPTTVLINKTGNVDAITAPFNLSETIFDNLLADKPSGLARPVAPVIVQQPAVAADKDKVEPVFSASLKRQTRIGGSTNSSPTHYFMYSGTVTDVLKWAYEVSPFRIIYKDAMPDSHWTVDVTFPPGQESTVKDYFKKMVPPGLGMTVAKGKQEMEVYVMKYEKVTPKEKKSVLTVSDPNLKMGHLSSSEGTVLGSHWAFSGILSQCQNLLGSFIMDETNLQGYYDLSLFYKEGDTASIIEALKDCGLIVIKEKRMMDVLFVANNK
jgi:uncharacterized protein (TIGR03435 family)